MVLLALLLATSVASGTHLSYDVRECGKVTDEQLNREFARKNGALRHKGKFFIEMEKKYNVSASFMAAIAIQESGHGTSKRAKTHKDCFGMTGSNARYNSIEENIEAAFRNMRNGKHYLTKNRTTICSIGKVYCRTKGWDKKIVLIMKKIHSS